MELRPSEIFYSQDSILDRFGNYTAHGNICIGETLDQLLNEHCNVQSIPNISVVQRNGKWFTSDNRRLWVFRKAEEIGFLKTIDVNKAYSIRDNKFTTENGGTSIRVRGGSPGGSLWRTWKPKRHPTTTTHIYPDEELTAEVMNRLTRCRYVKEGCRWVDKPQNLQAHLDQCRFEAISCPNKCSAFLSRLDLDDHLEYSCPKRFTQCDICNQQFPGDVFEKQHSGNCPFEVTWCENKCGAKLERRFIENHTKNECHKQTVECKYCNMDFVAETLQTHQHQCPRFPVACPNRCDATKIPREDLDVHVLAVCPSATVSCTFKDAGCTHKCPRFSLDKHIEDGMKQHLQLMCGLVKNQQTQITQLCNALYTLTHVTDGTFIWKITNYKQKFLESVYKSAEITSEPFYTNRYGYKMAASVCLNGNGAGEGKYLSVFMQLLPGEFDNILDWPFSLPFSFSVLDQNGHIEKCGHIKKSATPDPTWKNFQKPKKDIDHTDILEVGYSKFISHEILKTRNYIRDDCLIIKVSVDNDKFFHP